MDADTLDHVERDLRKQNGQVDKHVSSLKGKFSKLRKKETELGEVQRKVGDAQSWEVRQREARLRELERAKAEIQAEREQIVLLGEQAEKMRVSIQDLEGLLKSLKAERLELEEKYRHPSLEDVVLREAENFGPVSHLLANRTVEAVIPRLKAGLEGAGSMRAKVKRGSTLPRLLSSLCVYLLALSLFFVVYKFIRNMYRIMTLSRMLFTMDMAYVFIWCLVCFCYASILSDPLSALSQRNDALSVLLQLVLMTGLFGNVMFRCLFLSTCFGFVAFSELLCTVFVAQLYYREVWVPVLTDGTVKSTIWSYFLFLITNGTLAIYRARSVAKAMDKVQEDYDNEIMFLKNTRDWMKVGFGKVWQYCEEALTSGVDEKDLHESLLGFDSKERKPDREFLSDWEGRITPPQVLTRGIPGVGVKI